MDVAQFDQLAVRCRAWGQWGPDDEAGALNHIDSKSILDACCSVRQGKVFSLSIPFNRNGPQRQTDRLGRFNPVHLMIRTGVDTLIGVDGPPITASTDDVVSMPLQCATQWDSLAHIMYRGKMYNGRSAALVTADGAAKNSIDKVRSKFVGRGVLLDIARWKSQSSLDPGSAISADDLEKCCAHQHVGVRKGDFLLINTGFMTRYMDKGDWGDYSSGPAPGLDLSTPLWLKDKQVGGIASDTSAVEVKPSPIADVRAPWHALVIANAGITVGEIFYLKDLAEDCAKDKQYDFLFVAPPLPITGAVGSPVNPMAIK